ncbi:MAG: hypothetical protein ABSB22_18800 [Thermodesulfobacteriota bacterium]
MIDSLYFRDIVSSLEKVLYYERGRGAYFRATLVGKDFIDDKRIQGTTSEEVIESCVKVMREKGIVKDASSIKDKNGTLFTFEIEGCMHLPIEARLKEEGVPTYICPPVNMILYKIREILDLAVEIADITVNQDGGRCTIRVVVFKQD